MTCSCEDEVTNSVYRAVNTSGSFVQGSWTELDPENKELRVRKKRLFEGSSLSVFCGQEDSNFVLFIELCIAVMRVSTVQDHHSFPFSCEGSEGTHRAAALLPKCFL